MTVVLCAQHEGLDNTAMPEGNDIAFWKILHDHYGSGVICDLFNEPEPGAVYSDAWLGWQGGGPGSDGVNYTGFETVVSELRQYGLPGTFWVEGIEHSGTLQGIAGEAGNFQLSDPLDNLVYAIHHPVGRAHPGQLGHPVRLPGRAGHPGGGRRVDELGHQERRVLAGRGPHGAGVPQLRQRAGRVRADRVGAAAQGAGRRPERVGADADPGQLHMRRVGQRAGRGPAHPGPVRGVGRAAAAGRYRARVTSAGVTDALVIGAGVAGLSTAICLAEAGRRVVIQAAEPPGRTTSAVAGAVWGPHLVEDSERVAEWCADTLGTLTGLAGQPGTGVRLADGVMAIRAADAGPDLLTELAAVGDGIQPCAAAGLPAGFAAGWRYTAPVVSMPVYLDYLLSRFRQAGGELRIGAVASLAEAAAGTAAPVLVNCAGTGAHDLVPDPAVIPYRGQVVVAENPGLTEFFIGQPDDDHELVYVFPHDGRVVLGGTEVAGDWSARARPGHGRPDPCATAPPWTPGWPARGSSSTGSGSARPGPRSGWRPRTRWPPTAAARGCWCTTTATAAPGSRCPGAAPARWPAWSPSWPSRRGPGSRGRAAGKLEAGKHGAQPVQLDPLGRVGRGVLRVEPPVQQPEQRLGGQLDRPVHLRAVHPVRQA